jgi:hypothetical protein
MAEIERRRTRRFSASIPVLLRSEHRDVPGLIRDVSSAGAFVYVPPGQLLRRDTRVEFRLELPPEITLGGTVHALCEGKVVRVENSAQAGSAGLAIHISSFRSVGSA